MKRKIAASALAVALAVGGLVWASPAMAEEVVDPNVSVATEGPAQEDKGHPEFICDESGEGWQAKVDTTGDPATVTVTAPDGFLIDAYCVKAGTEKFIIDDFEPAASVVIDHPVKDSVSHYQVHLVKITVPEQPHKDPTFTTWTDGQWDCDDTTVVQTASRTDYTYTLEAGVWVEHSAVTPVTQERALTEDEIFACPPVNVVCEANAEGPVGTNLNGLWSNVDTRSAGHFEYVDGALHVWTDDATSNAKVSLGTAASFALSQSGQFGIDWEGTTPPPGVNLYVDFDNDGDIDGTLVFETVYGQDLWLTNGSQQFVKDAAPSHVGGNGSENHGTINEWLTVFPEAQVKGIAFSLGSGVHGDGLIKSLTIGCTVYTFDAETVEPEPVVVTLGAPVIQDKCGTAEDLGFRPEDTEGVTYEWADAEDETNLDIRAVIAEGHVVEDVPAGWVAEEGGSYVYAWTYEFTDEACPTTPENPTPATPAPAGTKATPVALAATGGGDVNPILPLAGGLTVALGITLMLMRRFARR